MVPLQNAQERTSVWNLVAKNSKPIVRLAGQGSGTSIYLVHAIGGDVGFFVPFAEMIADGRVTYGIQVPTHKLNAEFCSSIYAIAEYYVDALVQFQPEGPVILGGWSVGSTISLEMAHILKRRGREVSLLISFDGILYHTGARLRSWTPRYLSQLLGNVRHWVNDARAHRLGKVMTFRALCRDWKLAFACWAIERNVAGNVTDTFLDESNWPAKRLPFIRSLYDAVAQYYPKPYDGRVLVYLAKVQSFFHLWQVDVCWASIAPQAEFHSVSGMHANMFQERIQRQMGLHMREYLLKVFEPNCEGEASLTSAHSKKSRRQGSILPHGPLLPNT
jgi:thioesterase domain-containing protein